MKSIMAESNGSSFELMAAGAYAARCYSMIYMGTLKEEFNGEVKNQKKVRFSWEFPTEQKIFKPENGMQPYVISKDFTLSMHEKASLRKFLESWRGQAFTEDQAKSFDVTALLGKPCMLNIIHKPKKNGDMRLDMASVSKLPKGMECPTQINTNFVFTVLDFTQTEFDVLPEYIKDKVKTSKEYQAQTHQEIALPEAEDFETNTGDDLPF